MPRPTLLFTLSAALLAVVPLSASVVTVDTPAIAVEGRTASTGNGGLGLGFSGITLHWAYHGGEISLNASATTETVYFDVSVDGGKPALLQMKSGTWDYPIAPGVAVGDHEVTFARRTESYQGTCILNSLNLGTEGRLLAAPPLPARKLLFVGDSITCGEVAAWVPGTIAPTDPLYTDANVTYAKLTARALNSQCSLVSYGGKGIIRDWQGGYKTANAADFYELARPDVPHEKWNHQRYVPDAIGVLLGTNDFNQGIPDQNQFVNAYVEFLRVLRRDAPNACIFLMDSPMVDDDAERGPRRAALRGYLQRILEKFDDAHAYFVPMPALPGVPKNGHPSAADHERMAKVLTEALHQTLGW